MISGEAAFEFVLWIILEVVFIGTGEAVRWLVTLGRHPPRWKLLGTAGSAGAALASGALGAVVWGGVVLLCLIL